ncbi:MAG: hypothetical protein P4L53_04810 [Candidatus Obscuribacterales bacterium]|nr:hypothetical protein [Candidatus Obscuribacterales bacterium]
MNIRNNAETRRRCWLGALTVVGAMTGFAWCFGTIAHPLLTNYLFLMYNGANSTPVSYALVAWVVALSVSFAAAAIVGAVTYVVAAITSRPATEMLPTI